ncbi:MAG: flagellar biosynthetic protein FliQ [Planctomycetes bacterium]|nr:flagellar biosynthetic protein FliQ [Planctomycetota bacterium]
MDSSVIQQAIDISREAILVTIKLSAIPLTVGLVVGLIFSFIQTLTSIQEQTLALVPKMFAVIVTVFIILPWLLNVLMDYTIEIITSMGGWFN